MQILTRNFRNIFIFRNTIKQNDWLVRPRANFRSKITPVKMAVNVHESSSTDPNLPPLINMHGLFGSKKNWRTILRGLESTTKRKIYNVDARNHGDSPHDRAHGSAHMASDILYLLEEQNIKRCSVMGHSMGGRAMMFFTLKYRELVEKAIIVDISPASMPKNFDEMEQIFLAMKNINVSPKLSMAEGRKVAEQQIKDAVNDKETVDFILLNLKKLPSGEFVWAANVAALHENFSHFRSTQDFQLPPFSGPVLFICGKRSNYMKPNDWPKIKEIFPNAEIKWLDAGHLVHFDQPAQFSEIVTDFLNS